MPLTKLRPPQLPFSDSSTSSPSSTIRTSPTLNGSTIGDESTLAIRAQPGSKEKRTRDQRVSAASEVGGGTGDIDHEPTVRGSGMKVKCGVSQDQALGGNGGKCGEAIDMAELDATALDREGCAHNLPLSNPGLSASRSPSSRFNLARSLSHPTDTTNDPTMPFLPHAAQSRRVVKPHPSVRFPTTSPIPASAPRLSSSDQLASASRASTIPHRAHPTSRYPNSPKNEPFLIDTSAQDPSASVLSRNGSSTTTNTSSSSSSSSVDPSSSAGESSAGLHTPRDGDPVDNLPNRNTFGPIYDKDDVSLLHTGTQTSLRGFFKVVSDPAEQEDEDECDFHPPRFWTDSTTSSLDKTSQSTSTSSSGRTIQPLPQLQSNAYGLTPLPLSHDVPLGHGRPPDPPPSLLPDVGVASSFIPLADPTIPTSTTHRDGSVRAGGRLASIYDLSEILRSVDVADTPSNRRTSVHSVRVRSNSVGTISDWTRTLTRTFGEISADELEIREFLNTREPNTGFQAQNPSTFENHRQSLSITHVRAAPAPPHLSSHYLTRVPISTTRSTSTIKDRSDKIPAVEVGNADEAVAPPIPDRSSSVGVLWRRLSGRARASQRGLTKSGGRTREGSDGSALEIPEGVVLEDGWVAGEGLFKKEKRPGLMRALSRRKTATGGTTYTPRDHTLKETSLPPLPHHLPRTPFRRHFSVPPSRVVPSISEPVVPCEALSDGWTRLPTYTANHPAPFLQALQPAPPPPTTPPRIPNRQGSLPYPSNAKKEAQSPSPQIPHRLTSLLVPEVHHVGALALPHMQIAGIASAIATTPEQGDSRRVTTETAPERSRRFRRTLVEVEDDVLFQQLLLLQRGARGVEGLGIRMGAGQGDKKIGSDGAGQEGRCLEGAVGESAEAGILAGGDEDEAEIGREKHSVQAWFTTRELVQGEKRYGRLLARGVSIVRCIAERDIATLATSSSDFGLSMSTSSSLSSFFTSNSGVSRRSSKISHSATSSPPSTINLRRMSSGAPPHTRFASIPLSLSPSSTSSSPSCTPPDAPPLEILLRLLPRLLALSLTLSSRFAHDPSPEHVATAFSSVEDEMLSEMSEWAGEVGQMIAMGFGEALDRELRGDAELVRSSMFEFTSIGLLSPSSPSVYFDTATTSPIEDGQSRSESRVSFSEILLAPIQRATRYKLLFRSLLSKIPMDPDEGEVGRDAVQLALLAAERIVKGVNAGQGYDLEGLRRGAGADGAEDGDGQVIMPLRKKSQGRRMQGAGRRVRSLYT